MPSITLYQHTPLIHFQGNQSGATLRATDVKPRLDRWIIDHYGDDPVPDSWYALTDEDNQQSLNYRLRIIPGTPVSGVHLGKASQYANYFADMSGSGPLDHKEPRKVTMHETLQLVFTCPVPSLAEKLTAEALTPFFYANNFGTRSTKGFGSFSPAISPNRPDCKWVFKFYVGGTDYRRLFQHLEFFHRSVRTGLNNFRDPDNHKYYPEHMNGSSTTMNSDFYMKPLIFSYAIAPEHGYTWEKKVFKSFSNRPLTAYRNAERDYADEIRQAGLGPKEEWPLWYPGQNRKQEKKEKKALVRDALGLAAQQEWPRWDFGGVSKKSTAPKDSDMGIDRAPSPFTFSPVMMKNGFAVYVYARQPAAVYLNHSFGVTAKKEVARGEGKTIGELAVFPNFSMEAFLRNYFNVAHVKQAIVTKTERDRQLKDKLLAMYRQIQDSLQLQNITPPPAYAQNSPS